jgi:hypothetical protein
MKHIPKDLTQFDVRYINIVEALSRENEEALKVAISKWNADWSDKNFAQTNLPWLINNLSPKFQNKSGEVWEYIPDQISPRLWSKGLVSKIEHKAQAFKREGPYHEVPHNYPSDEEKEKEKKKQSPPEKKKKKKLSSSDSEEEAPKLVRPGIGVDESVSQQGQNQKLDALLDEIKDLKYRMYKFGEERDKAKNSGPIQDFKKIWTETYESKDSYKDKVKGFFWKLVSYVKTHFLFLTGLLWVVFSLIIAVIPAPRRIKFRDAVVFRRYIDVVLMSLKLLAHSERSAFFGPTMITRMGVSLAPEGSWYKAEFVGILKAFYILQIFEWLALIAKTEYVLWSTYVVDEKIWNKHKGWAKEEWFTSLFETPDVDESYHQEGKKSSRKGKGKTKKRRTGRRAPGHVNYDKLDDNDMITYVDTLDGEIMRGKWSQLKNRGMFHESDVQIIGWTRNGKTMNIEILYETSSHDGEVDYTSHWHSYESMSDSGASDTESSEEEALTAVKPTPKLPKKKKVVVVEEPKTEVSQKMVNKKKRADANQKPVVQRIDPALWKTLTADQKAIVTGKKQEEAEVKPQMAQKGSVQLDIKKQKLRLAEVFDVTGHWLNDAYFKDGYIYTVNHCVAKACTVRRGNQVHELKGAVWEHVGFDIARTKDSTGWKLGPPVKTGKPLQNMSVTLFITRGGPDVSKPKFHIAVGRITEVFQDGTFTHTVTTQDGNCAGVFVDNATGYVVGLHWGGRQYPKPNLGSAFPEAKN